MLFRAILTLAGLLLAPSWGWAACTFTLTPTSATFSNLSNDTVVQVSASASSCAWTTTSNSAWITIAFGFSGTGNGSVGFTVLQNTGFAQRTGSLTIAGTNFPVTQAGAPCTYGLSPSSVSLPAGGGNGSFNVISGCSWLATSNNPDWLSTIGSGTGNGLVTYSAAPNPNLTSRSGTISVGTQNFTVNQAAACAFTLNPVSVQAAASGGTGTFQVQPSSNSCAWTAASNNPDFITVTSGTSGTGNGTVGYSVSANTVTSARSGSIAVGNTAFGIYQPGGTPCSYTLSPPSASYASSGGVASFGVTSSCPWTPSTNADWITISGPASSSGNDTVRYSVAPNPAAVSRSGVIIIGTSGFTIVEAGVPCAVTVSQNSFPAPAAGAMGSIDVNAPDSCNWNAVSGANWITLATTSGSGQGSVSFTVASSTVPKQRSGTITIANQLVNITQDAAVCSPALTPDHASITASSATYTFHISTGCDYTATSNSGWIKIVSGASGTGESDVAYSVSQNSSADARIGSITAGGLALVVSQSGASCSVTLSPTSANVPPGGGSGIINVAATNSCRWEPATDSGWIRFTYAVANGNGRVNYTVDPAAGAARMGNIFIAGQTFSISQDGRPALEVSSDGVVNGGSFLRGPVAPGEIIAIFGNGIGPNDPASLQLSADGQFITTVLSNTRVLFDNTPAPLIYVSSTQIVAIVPYKIAGQTVTTMTVEYLGIPSSPVQLDVGLSAPGLFTQDSSGSGQGAILNQDLSGNSPDNPAEKDSVVVLYATGEGQTGPPGVDGKLGGPTPPKPTQKVTAQIGGLDATVQYAGGAQGLTAGVMQVNVLVPLETPSGAVSVVLKVGNATSQANVTLNVR